MVARGMFTQERLDASLGALGVADSGPVFGQLREAYGEAGRHYHTAEHVAECLHHFERLRPVARNPAEIEVALWFHDAVYDSRAGDNEEQSAVWASRFLNESGVNADAVGRIERLILATKTHEPYDIDSEIMLDVDLGILGAPADAFEAYDEAIRREYHWVPEADYRSGRARVLSSFLDRPVIYRTPVFFEAHEAQARDNLRRKIEELT